LASNDEIFCSENRTGMSLGATVGIVVAGAFVIFWFWVFSGGNVVLDRKIRWNKVLARQLILLLYSFQKKKNLLYR